MNSEKVIGTLTVVALILITIVVIMGLISDSANYSAALEAVSAGNYSIAKEKLEEVRYGFRDRELLLSYISVMEDYDPADIACVYRAYKTVNTLCESDSASETNTMFDATLQSMSNSYYSMFGENSILG